MATAELGDWHVGRCNVVPDADVAELVIFEIEEADEGWSQLRISGLPALIALRDLIDEELRRGQERRDLAGSIEP